MCDTQSANNTNDVNTIHDKSSNIDTDIPVVVKTNETKLVVIPLRSGQEAMVKQEVEDYLQRFSEIVIFAVSKFLEIINRPEVSISNLCTNLYWFEIFLMMSSIEILILLPP